MTAYRDKVDALIDIFERSHTSRDVVIRTVLADAQLDTFAKRVETGLWTYRSWTICNASRAADQPEPVT